ncbi:MAG: AAA family ATPase [Chloroflexi bacterium]|nr:AAA family ATPase [Chloroflexota bacterium]
MTCSRCGTENRAGRKFCSSCGAGLALGCPTCGAAYEPGERFCGECGTALQAPATGPASGLPATAQRPPPGTPAANDAATAERRLVTVLFADLVGFTPFAEERDAEDVRDVLSRYFAIATEVIERYGGKVEKFIGDAVMALWGAPVAREDDAERAVRAALELVDAVRTLGPTIHLRAGVLTGEAAVTLGATNQGMVAGDIVNTAARLQSIAPPGRVLVGESTHHAASKAIVFEEAGEQVLKGKALPVPAWLAVRVVAQRGGRGRSDVLEAPFVGRDDELRLLKDLYHAAARERRARLVSVIGPGGIGKSRLAWEFEKYIDGIVTKVMWHQGRAPAYGEGISFWALGEMIRGRAGLVETDGEEETRAKIAAMLATYIPNEAERRWIEPAMLALLGIAGTEVAADQLFAAWRTFFDRLSDTGPVILLFEDLQWADSGLLDFVDHLLEWSRDRPIYVLTLARPELLETRSDWGAGRKNFLSLGLEPLAEGAMRQLLAGLVPGLPKITADAIVARADGIPLYAVETVRMLLATGQLREEDGGYVPVGDITTIAVPDTLTALIGARLDALDPIDRALLQDASVLGQSFASPGLAAVSGRSAEDIEPRLRALARREILSVVSDARSPERGQYAFVQALIREVAYNTLTKKDRRERHLAAARFFESAGSDELAGALAGQYLSAYENSPAGPESEALAVQARLALTGAADRASALGSPAQALSFLERAMTIEVDAEHQSQLVERAAREAMISGRYRRAEELGRRAIELYAASGDRLGQARMLVTVSRALASNLNSDEAEAIVRDALPAFDDLVGTKEHIELLLRMANVKWIADDNDEAVAWADKALIEAERYDVVQAIVNAMITKGGALGYTGRGYEGISTMRGAYALAEAHAFQDGMLRAQTNLSDALISRDPRSALETARAGLEVVRHLGRLDFLSTLTLNGAYPAFRTGDWDWAVAEAASLEAAAVDDVDRAAGLLAALVIDASRGVDVSERLERARDVMGTGTDNQALATVEDTSGAIAFAEGRLDDAYALSSRAAGMIAWLAPVAYLTAARSALWLRDAGRAGEALERLRNTTHGPAIAASKTTIEAGLAALAGDRDRALGLYRSALDAWATLGLPVDEALTAIDMATLLGPGLPAVEAAATAARDTFRRLRAATFLARLTAAMGWSPSGPSSDGATAAPARPAAEAAPGEVPAS